jgi:Galactose oxidase, central domain
MKPGKARQLIAVAVALLVAAGCASSEKTIQFAPPVAGPPTGDLVDSRYAATATVLTDGEVLIAGGVASENSTSAEAELYDPATGAFRRTGSLSTGRSYHTATLLKDGRVLIAGGLGASGHPVETAELYDPASGTFTTTGSMLKARYDFTASLLPSGKVMMAGGATATLTTANLATAELYDPATGTFSATGNVKRYYDPSIDKFYYEGQMVAVHAEHTATVLKNGDVLIAGGEDAHGAAQAAAEIYVASSGKFVGVGPMNFARREHRATILRNGQVLITGGVDKQGGVQVTAELYNPATRKFTLTTAAFPGEGTNMKEARAQHTAVLLRDGRVLIAGGTGAKSTIRGAELYDPSRGTFTCVGGGGAAYGMACSPSMNEYRNYAADALLPNGEVLIAGGYNFHMVQARNISSAQSTIGGTNAPFSVLWTAEVYNPASGTFVSTVRIAHAHFGGAPN